MTLASEVAILTPDDPQKPAEIFTEIIREFPYIENEGVASSIFQFLNHPVVTAL
jgi:hypothetical protein